MGQRRMFSNKIVNSAKFLKMPVSTQLLYFHLGMKADDDGVVEGFNVLRTVGLNEDDLKLLVVKGFVQILNDDLVTFIIDWREHNLIRADRKTDSIYKDLLLKVLPATEILQSRQRADSKKKDDGRPKDDNGTSNGQHKLSKDKLSKDNNISKDICSTNVQLIIDEWNSLGLNKVISINKGTNRSKLLNARIKEYGEEEIINAIKSINNSSFLKGQNKNNWVITFDWLIKPNNFIKVLEGNYDDIKPNVKEEKTIEKKLLDMY